MSSWPSAIGAITLFVEDLDAAKVLAQEPQAIQLRSAEHQGRGIGTQLMEILEVHGAAGAPPYLVRWSDTDHESLVFPGPDATVQHFDAEPVQSDVPEL